MFGKWCVRILMIALVWSLAGGLILPLSSQRILAQDAATPESGATISIHAAWSQIDSEGTLQARAVVDADCPAMTVDGSAGTMSVRAQRSDAFPIVVCEAPIPVGAMAIDVGGVALPTIVAQPRRVIAIGDTGCEVFEARQQSCNDLIAWPFARVAERAADSAPDLVIHTGDYVSRESACPDDVDGCAGSPFGDNWDTWRADFFDPAEPLLNEAPWIFVRGNHDSCSRMGEGWSRLLAPTPYTGQCLERTDPYAVEIGNQRAIVLDAATALDLDQNPALAQAYAEQFRLIEELAGDQAVWLLSHKSFWSLGADGDGNPLEWTTATFTEAGYLQPPDAVETIVAGHVDMAQILRFTPESGRPVVLISGNGGTIIEQFDGGVFAGVDLEDASLVEGVRYASHGFLSLEASDAGWVATFYQVEGPPLMSCLVVQKQAACLRYSEPGM